MSVGLSHDFKEIVRSRTDLAALIGETVSLTPQRGGSDYLGLCPFHDDHNPSFHVYPDRQSWRCWVCNEGGDCFSFIQKIEGVAFFDALKILADRANLEMPRGRGDSEKYAREKTERDQMFAALRWAEDRMHECLVNSAEAVDARKYLETRGFSRETIVKFRLGYHPESRNWLLDQGRKQFGEGILIKARVAEESKYGHGTIDSFKMKNRVIFPIRNVRGRTVSFGARVLPGNEGAKYLNGDESEVFFKSEVLYGLDVAKDAIRRSRRAIVVEGYTDCISLSQAGIENVVATLGTALTDQHVTRLKQICDEVILIYDGDAAGQMNADRVVSKFLAQALDLKILTLPDNLDPPEYLESHGVESFQALLGTALEAWEFKYANLLRKYGTDTIGSRQSILEAMLSLMGQTPNLAGTPREDSLVGLLSRRTLVPEKNVRKQLRDVRSKKSPDTQGAEAPSAPEELGRLLSGRLNKHEKLEAEILEILFVHPERTGFLQNRLAAEVFENHYFRELYQFCCDLYERGTSPAPQAILSELERDELKRLTVVIDDWSRNKGIQEKLADLDARDNIPVFLRQALENMDWKREVARQERTRGEIAGYTSAAGEFSDRDRDLLRQAAEHHQKRIQKKPVI